MEKKELEQIITNVFKELDFKKKGTNWKLDNGEITKVINLQKSQYGNSYYINYGFIINSIPLEMFHLHINRRLASHSSIENEEIKENLDLENNISDDERSSKLIFYIEKFIKPILNEINNEKDIYNYLIELPDLSLVHFKLKEHFHLL